MFGGVLLFRPFGAVSSALAGLASGFGMGPGVSLPLWTAVTLFSRRSIHKSSVPLGLFLVVGCDGSMCLWVWLRVVVCCKFSAG